MYVSAISIRLLRGRSTPAIRAMVHDTRGPLCRPWARAVALELLVARVAADDADDALALDDLALRANRFDAGADLHGDARMGSVGGRRGRARDGRGRRRDCRELLMDG